MTHHPPARFRVLLIDGSPGATTLLVLAAHGAIPRFDAVMALDTGRNLARAHPLIALRRVAVASGMDWILATTEPTVQSSLDGSVMPLPLFTLSGDGVPGQLPQGCARRQGVTLSGAVRRLLGYPRPRRVPEGVVVECATGTTLGQAPAPPSTGPRYVRITHPLIDIGWTSSDCAALLAHHGLPADLDLVCSACPMRSNGSWRRLRETDPATFAEAIAVDVTLRHGHPSSAPRGMPPGTTYYVHPSRAPLADVDLGIDLGAVPDGCSPWSCRSDAASPDAPGGEDR